MEDIIQRAFELAKSGRYLSISQIREELHKQGYSYWELRAITGSSVQRQLRLLIVNAQQD
jgi:hypothetical protein